MHPLRKPAKVIAERFAKLFAAHGVQPSQIPRLIPAIKYEDLDNPKALLAALSPAVIDACVQLFDIRSQWLEGLDDMPYQVNWARGKPKALLSLLSGAISSKGEDQNQFPLRVLTTSIKLDRQGSHQQWLLPVIVETVRELGDTLIHRCHIFGNHYDWTNEAHRLELKALSWVVYHQLGSPVSFYHVTPKEMEKFMMGEAIPSVLWRKGLLSEPSLEDYALSKQESVQAKETDELPKLLAYLDASGLKNWQLEASLPSKTDETAPVPSEEATNAAPPTLEKPTPGKRMARGKREIKQADWDALLTVARGIWSEDRTLPYVEVIRRLKAMPHLKAAAMGESAIRKQLQKIAPPEVRGKAGRKANKSA